MPALRLQWHPVSASSDQTPVVRRLGPEISSSLHRLPDRLMQVLSRLLIPESNTSP
jgi:hypothetical protein